MRIFNYIFLCGTLYPVVNFLFPKKSYTESKFLGISISLPIKMRIFARSNNSRDKKMKFIHILCVAAALWIGNPVLNAQTAGDAGFFLHTVAQGQSLYSISRMYNVPVSDIVRLNPGSDQKIRTGETLKIPQASAAKQGPQYHTIQRGETLYQLTVKYGVTAQAICAANPGLSASNFRVGQVIVVPVPDEKTEAQPSSTLAKQGSEQAKDEWKTMHKVQRRETIFSICRQYGISEEELLAANPELKKGKLKRGTFLFIPYPEAERQAMAEVIEAAKQAAAEPTNEELFRQNAAEKKPINTIKVALVLPFSKENGAQREPQTRIVEFYEGFLMAADSLKRQGVSMDIYAYDTKETKAGAEKILADSRMKEMDLIVGPVNAASIAPLTDFARQNNIRLVVPFAPKVDQVFNNPLLYQVNTPQSYLYSEVYEHFLRKFGRSNVVFLDDGTPDPEKADFIKGMKAELKDNGVRFTQIRLEGEIDPARVISAMDTLQQNIFVPLSARSTALTKLVPHLTLVRKEHPHFDMHLFGYPEWQTYTQDFLANFYELDTYFYSSFYTNNLFPAAVDFTHAYRHWYSKDMANIYPKYGMLGFDIGYYFLKGLSQYGNKLEDNLDRMKVVPIQTGFKFERVNNWGGFINRKIFFVHFSQDYELIKLDFE